MRLKLVVLNQGSISVVPFRKRVNSSIVHLGHSSISTPSVDTPKLGPPIVVGASFIILVSLVFLPFSIFSLTASFSGIVYVGSDQQLAFDCKWIAVGAKKYERPITAGAPSPKPTERDYQRAKETTDKYVAYAQRMSRWSDWDPETSRKRVLETMNRIAVESGIEFGASVAVASTSDSASVKRHYETDFEQNCATLLEFMLKRNNEAAATASTSASSISDPIEHNRWRVSEGAQTDTDLELFKQLRDWAYDVSMSVHPNQLEEFWARFARIESSFGRQ